MTAPKYQVFISSTYDDLKPERDQIIKAVLEMGHIPVGMEMFSAADEEQWKIIARQIESSDYYAVLVAHRYGSIIPAENISYTEKEYDYAVSQGVPVIGFVLEAHANWPADFVDKESKKKKGLDAFREKVKKKPVGFWSTGEELHGKFAIAFGKLINTTPRPGWVRASGASGPEVAEEISRLSSENRELRKENDVLKEGDTPQVASVLSWLNEEFSLAVFANYSTGNSRAYSKHTETLKIKLYWYEILQSLIPKDDTILNGPQFKDVILDLAKENFARTVKGLYILEDFDVKDGMISSILKVLINQKLIQPVPIGSIDDVLILLTEHKDTFISAFKTLHWDDD